MVYRQNLLKDISNNVGINISDIHETAKRMCIKLKGMQWTPQSFINHQNPLRYEINLHKSVDYTFKKSIS